MRRITALLMGCTWAMAVPIHAGTPDDVPVVWDSPGCVHQKLASVEIEVGEKVSEITRDPNVPTVDYARAMDRLSEAARGKGANAVVLRWHQGVYFTRSGKQSRRPVYVKLRGAAIHMADPAHCQLRPVDVAELEARSISGKPMNVTSREAFTEE